jgi:uncharacterized protein YcbK (DUF882 family)
MQFIGGDARDQQIGLNAASENRGYVLPKLRSATDLTLCARGRSDHAATKLIGAKFGAARAFIGAHSPGSKIFAAGLIGASFLLFAPSSTESAAANGDTRAIYLYQPHTRESIDATYRVDGRYDPEVLKKLNWFLRDWRLNEATDMDPRLFDAVWEAYRGAGATNRIVVLCGFRSPQTNAMLRRRSRAVAEHSQHILGKAMDTTMPGMSMERVRESAARLQMGGVGYYGDTNFVHIDVGGVRMWPRMSYAQLMRLFPDGKTVHIASDGRTLPGYEEARAELAANGTAIASLPPAQNSGIGAFFAWLLGKGGGEDEDNAASPSAPQAVQTAQAQDSTAQDSTAQEPTAQEPTAPAAPKTAMQANATGSLPDPAEASAAAPPAAAKAAAVDMPLPPERPTGLLVAAAVPLPPERPALARAAADPAPDTAPQPAPAPTIVAEADTAPPELPGLITQGPNDGRPPQDFSRTANGALPQALAYAPVAQMEGLRSAVRLARSPAASQKRRTAHAVVTIVPARLDGSNFDTLTGGTDVAELASATIFGPTLVGLRSAARVEASALSNRPSAGYLARFEGSVTALSAEHFGGPAVVAFNQDRHLVFMDGVANR